MSREIQPLSRTLPGVVAAILLVSACGSDEPEVTEQAPAPVAQSTTPTPTPTPAAEQASPSETVSALEPAEQTLDAEVWLGTHRFEVGTAVLEPTEIGGRLSLDVVMENLSERDSGPDGGALWLAVDGASVGTPESSLPTVPAGASGKGEIAFSVDESFALQDAVLRFGAETVNSSAVPFDGSPVTTIAPATYDPPAEGSTSVWSITPESVTTYAQDIWNGYDVETGEGYLLIGLSATLLETDTSGMNISSGDFSLRLPDGTSRAAEGGAYPGINEVISGGATIPDLQVTFPFMLEETGEYALVFAGQRDEETIEMAFTIE